MKAIAITSITLAFAVCTLGATTVSSGTSTWADHWAADDAKCRGYGHDPVIAAKDYVNCRGELQEKRGNKWREYVVKRSGQPTAVRLYVDPLNTCSTGSDAGGC